MVARQLEYKRLVATRAGSVDTAGMEGDEARLVAEEGADLLRGVLCASDVRWVDDPFRIQRAETKLHQLATAAALRIPTPPTLVTNDPSSALSFGGGRRVIAKPVSSGAGIAPSADEPTAAELDAEQACPVMLQELVTATADLRVVVVAAEAWVWQRPREPTTTDWRSVDPSGEDFAPVSAPDVGRMAITITSALGLTMAAQDWLATPDGPVFLEANPQGSWLFLRGADLVVVPALARHLIGPVEDGGTWPTALTRFGWDFLTKRRAPPNDGVIAPTLVDPPWISHVATTPGVLDVARRAHDTARDSAKTAEDKAARLVTAGLTLLTVALALGAYQLSFILRTSAWWAPTIVPVGTAFIFLSLAVFEAIEIDRVGIYRPVVPEDLAHSTGRDPTSVLLAREEEGRRQALWTSQHKFSDLMQARAWFSRAIALLLIAGVTAAVARAGSATASAPSTHGTTTTASTRPVATTTSPSATPPSRP